MIASLLVLYDLYVEEKVGNYFPLVVEEPHQEGKKKL